MPESGSTAAVISALALGLLYLSHPTLVVARRHGGFVPRADMARGQRLKKNKSEAAISDFRF
jgi:hypothetical protein